MRPSKKFFYTLFSSDLSKISVNIAVDAASSEMKNYKYFKAKNYHGIDINYERLKKGLKKHPNAVAIAYDLRSIKELFPPHSVDLIVSTNTLEHLPSTDQVKLVESFVSLLKHDGTLIFNKHNNESSDPIEHLISESFERVKITYYRNMFSKLIESFVQRKDGYYPNNREMKGHQKVLNFIGFIIERILSRFKSVNNAKYFRCQHLKSKHSSNNEFRILIDSAILANE
jgi:SAM-dependent methyltransferase